MTTAQRDTLLLSLATIAAFAGLLVLAFELYAPRPHVPVAFTPPPSPSPVGAISLPEDALAARAAILYNPTTKEVLYAKNEEAQLPLASLAKLATALATLTADENRIIVVEADDLAEEGDSGLDIGQAWRLRDLIAFGLTTSSNDAMAAAARALSREGTVERMNADAKAAGMTQSYFLNPTGLDLSSSTAGAYGSARDVAYLVEALLRKHPHVFEATAYQPAAGGKATSTLSPLYGLSGFVAGKTGYTDLAGGNLAAVVDIGLNEPVIAVVLGSTIDGRFADVEALVAAAAASRAAPAP